MWIQLQQVCSVTLVLFSVIDVIGSLPLIVDLRSRSGPIQTRKTTLVAGVIMVAFLFVGETILHLFGTDVRSFAIAGALVIFAIGVEMVLGIHLFKEEPAALKSAAIVPLAFPFIAGTGTLTTILTLKADYGQSIILIGILLNLVVVYLVLRSSGWFERRLGAGGLHLVRKVFGIVLLSIAVKILRSNLLG
jgi:multiple antibiotic resistance protein